jgi:hypothetical protein
MMTPFLAMITPLSSPGEPTHPIAPPPLYPGQGLPPGIWGGPGSLPPGIWGGPGSLPPGIWGGPGSLPPGIGGGPIIPPGSPGFPGQLPVFPPSAGQLPVFPPVGVTPHTAVAGAPPPAVDAEHGAWILVNIGTGYVWAWAQSPGAPSQGLPGQPPTAGQLPSGPPGA